MSLIKSLRVGFDMDGVLLNDLSLNEGIPAMLDARKLCEPMFNPAHVIKKFYLVTARPVGDRQDTEDWLERVGISPQVLHHENTDITKPALYKTRIINRYGFDVFIESCPLQAKHLRRFTDAKIILFSEFITDALSKRLQAGKL